MKKFFTILVLLIACNPIFSQNKISYPGHMGKRVLINAELSMAPNFGKIPNFNGNTKYWAFNYLLCPNIEVIVHRKGTLGAQFTWFDTKFSISDGNWNTVYEDMRVFGGGIFYKQYFGSDVVAPLGNYFRFSFDVMHYQHLPNPETITRLPAEYLQSGLCYGLKAEYGRDFLFCDFLKLDIGLALGVSFPGFGFGFWKGSYAENTMANRVFRNYFLGVKVGIGFLAF